MKLYSFTGSCALATQIVLEWIGKPYTLELMDKADLGKPEYLAISPNGTVPAIEHEGWSLWGNSAILNYLTDCSPEAGLNGDGSPRSRAEVARWLGLISSDVHPAFKPLFGATAYLDDDAARKTRENARARLRKYYELLDQQLAGRDWLTGQRSIADAYLFITLVWTDLVDVNIEGLEHLAAFSERMRADSGVQNALKAQGLS